MSYFQFLIIYLLWQRRYGSAPSVLLLTRKLVTIVVITALAAAAAWFTKQEFAGFCSGLGTTVDALFVAVFSAVPFFAVVLILYQVTGVLKVREIIALFHRKQ